MLPDYVARHNSQDLGFKGSDLAEKRRGQLRARAPEMDADSIHSLGGDRFHVQSATDSLRKYLVDLGNQSCDCPDWPKVRLCKHVSAVHHFFGHSDLQPVGCPKTPPPNGEVSPDIRSDGAATATILENVINVSRGALSDGVPSSTDTVRSLRAVEAHLTAVVRSTRSSESLLPDQEQIPPNQRGSMWAETAKRMGATQRRKRSRTTPEPPSSARIGDLNRKQARVKLTDPYSGGVSSGRAAAPDARSAARNAAARARAAPTLVPPTPAPSTPQFTWYPPGVQAPAPIPMPAGPSSNPFPPSVPIPAPYPPAPGMYVHTPYHSGYPPYWPYTYFPPPPRT